MQSQKRIILAHFQGKSFNITVIQVYLPTTTAEEGEVNQLCKDLQNFLELTPKQTNKNALYIIGDWNEKEASQDIPRKTDKFSLGVQNKSGQRLTEFIKRTCWT